MNYPCFRCERRSVGCHSNCKAYLEVKARNEKFYEEKHKNKKAFYGAQDFLIDNIGRELKRRARDKRR